MPFFIAPAGSNVAYIERIFKQEKNIPVGLAYHDLKFANSWTHDLDYSKIDNQCIKIFFTRNYEIIILNWFYKILKYPMSNIQKKFGQTWIDSQKNIWKNYGDKWKVRAFCRWMYNIANDKSYSSKIPPPGNNFCGTVLYDGYENVRDEFGRFNINYSYQSYDSWLTSQYVVLKSLDTVRNINAVSQIHNLTEDCQKGVSLALYGLKHQLSEDNVWDDYSR